MLARFRREMKLIASQEHPTIVPVYDFGEHEGQPYIVMRHMPCGSLHDRMQDPMPLPDTARILNRLARGLDKAHRRGIVHRDLKPANMLFDQEGLPYVADFCIALLMEATQVTAPGTLLDTPTYMSPEQVNPQSRALAIVMKQVAGVLWPQMAFRANRDQLGASWWDLGMAYNRRLTRRARGLKVPLWH